MSVEALTWALNHSRAKGNARLVLIVIANGVSPETGMAWPGIRHIARQAGGLCERTVQNAIADLCALGELRVTPRLIDGQQKTNLYEMVPLSRGGHGADSAGGANSAPGAASTGGSHSAGAADSAPVNSDAPPRCTQVHPVKPNGNPKNGTPPFPPHRDTRAHASPARGTAQAGIVDGVPTGLGRRGDDIAPGGAGGGADRCIANAAQARLSGGTALASADVDLRRSPRDRFLLELDSGPDFAAIFADAYRSSHGGKEPAYTLLANVTSAANDLLARGCPSGDLEAAVTSCARTNRGAGLLDVVLAEVQGGERPPGGNRRAAGVTRAAALEAWEARHSGRYDQ